MLLLGNTSRQRTGGIHPIGITRIEWLFLVHYYLVGIIQTSAEKHYTEAQRTEPG